MKAFRQMRLQRWVARVVVVTLLLPTLVACTTPQAPRTVELAAIVVDGSRLAEAGEAGGYRLVRVIRDGVLVPVRAGMPLRLGDRVETSDRVEAVIRYPSGSEIFMRPNSGGRIGSFTEMVGEVFAKIKGLFSVDTTFVKAGAIGTAYLVRAAANGPATVIVFEGRVRCESPTGAWAPVEIGKGAMIVAYTETPRPVEAGAAEMRQTLEWVDRMERLAPAPTGVSGASVAVAAAALLAGILLSRDSSPPPPSSGYREPQREPTPGNDFREPQRPPALRAPEGASPGSTDPQQVPTLSCRAPLALRWNAVAGASDYVVDADLLPVNSRGWRDLPVRTTRATRTVLDPGVNGLVRWTVRARSGETIGPPSPLQYLRCTTSAAR